MSPHTPTVPMEHDADYQFLEDMFAGVAFGSDTPAEELEHPRGGVPVPVVPRDRDEAWQLSAAAFLASYKLRKARVFQRDAYGNPCAFAEVARDRYHEYCHIQLNTRQYKSRIVVDIDGAGQDDAERRADALARLSRLPAGLEPSWVVITDKGIHAGWLINTVDIERGPLKHRRFLDAMRENLRHILGGDNGYGHDTMRNPVFVGADSYFGELAPRRMHDMWVTLKAAGLWTSDIARHSGQGKQEGTGRNDFINRETFHAAVDDDLTEAEIHAYAHGLNSMESPPLPKREVDGIAASVTRAMSKARTTGHTGKYTVEESRKGGLTNSPAQRDARKLGPAAASQARVNKSNDKRERARAMFAQGYDKNTIMDTIGIKSRTTANLYLKDAPGPRKLTIDEMRNLSL